MAGPTTPLWEVFIRSRNGLAHKHVGSLHAADSTLALQAARDLYTRRGEGLSIWVVPSNAITASDPADKDMMFEPTASKIYRHPTFYEVPEGRRPHVSAMCARFGRVQKKERARKRQEDTSWPPPASKWADTPLLHYVLRRADDALILGHRLSEWCGHAPLMEEEMALANMGPRPDRPGPLAL